MNEKNLFALLVILLVVIGVFISWQLAIKFGSVADLRYIEIIITTAVFLSGFGLLAMDKKDSVFFVNIKQIIGWSMLSIILAFCYIIFQGSQLEKLFFTLSAGFLFFTITLVFILVLFHDNKYMKEIEKPKND